MDAAQDQYNLLLLHNSTVQLINISFNTSPNTGLCYFMHAATLLYNCSVIAFLYKQKPAQDRITLEFRNGSSSFSTLCRHRYLVRC